MFVKPCLVSIYAVLLFNSLGKAARIPTFKCMQIGWEMCNIRQIDIDPADRMMEDRSCFVDRGSNITIGFNFTPRFETFNLKWGIWVETVIGDYKLEGVPSDARNLANYPTVENKLNHFQSVIHIPNNTRTKLWVVRVTITGDSDRDVCCFLCEIRVRKPQLTTISSTVYDPTNPYDIIRKKISYPSIWDFNKVVKNFQNNPNIFNKFIINNAVTTPRPSYLSMIKNAFKRLLGFKSETAMISKVPFLGNASSPMEYLNGMVDQSELDHLEQKIIYNETTASEISSVNIERECTSTSEIITEESTKTELTTVPSIGTESETVVNTEDVLVNTVDYEQNFATEDENETGSYENDDSTEQSTTLSTVETTHIKRRSRTIVRTSRPLKKGTLKRGSKKVSRSGIKKTIKSTTK